MVSAFFRFVSLGVLVLVCPICAWANGLAMHGQPRYDDTTPFAYVNSDAPKGGVLRVGAVGSFDSLNPFIVRGTPAFGLNSGYLGGSSMGLVYESLMARSWDEPFSLYGLIASHAEMAEDRSSVIFTLDPRARFSDGRPVTVDDVIFSYKTLRDQGRPNHRMYYKKVLRVEKTGDHGVTFVFARSMDGKIDREMPLIMGLMPILPKHDWADRPFNQTTLRLPVGSGPYKITQVDVGRAIVFERDPNYWGWKVASRQGTFNFDTVRMDYYRDNSIALQAFKARAFDIRLETNPAKWATAYEGMAGQDSRMVREAITHKRTEDLRGFIFNVRRPLFQDIVLRKAMTNVFDFGWVNQTLFHHLYKRSLSTFPNTDLAADLSGPPEGKEREILTGFGAAISADLMNKPVDIHTTEGSAESLRQVQVGAANSLKDAGYKVQNGLLYTPDGTPVRFEVLLNDPAEEKVALAWARSLKRLGIDVAIRTVDSAQYQARLSAFDYDVVAGKWVNSLSPGNEQSSYWGCGASHQSGSRNYAGVCDVAVDHLTKALMDAPTREDLVATTKALDRVLMSGFYLVPFYYWGVDAYAYANTLHHPVQTPLYGQVVETWWKVDQK